MILWKYLHQNVSQDKCVISETNKQYSGLRVYEVRVTFNLYICISCNMNEVFVTIINSLQGFTRLFHSDGCAIVYWTTKVKWVNTNVTEDMMKIHKEKHIRLSYAKKEKRNINIFFLFSFKYTTATQNTQNSDLGKFQRALLFTWNPYHPMLFHQINGKSFSLVWTPKTARGSHIAVKFLGKVSAWSK